MLYTAVCELLIAATLAIAPGAAEPKQDVLVVDDFDAGIQNRLGGYRNVFERSPSSAAALRITAEARGCGGRAMRIRAHRAESGFCGLWIHLYDFHAASPAYFDSRDYDYLSFWIKGAKGGETLTVKLADRSWIEKQDAIPLGTVSQFLDGGVTRQWQEVLVPLSDNRQLDRANLGGITLEFPSAGQYTIYIDDVSFKTSRDVAVPMTAVPMTAARRVGIRGPEPSCDHSLESVASAGVGASPVSLPSAAAVTQSRGERFSRALWVWTTDEIMKSPQAQHDLLDFCTAQGVNQIWLQLPYTIQTQMPAGESTAAPATLRTTSCLIRDEQHLRRFLQQAHQKQIEVHALDGYPEFALREYHYIPLAVVEAVIDFNRRAATSQRFDGIHFDNEPHLLVGWQNPKQREQILKEFLDLNWKCQSLIRAERGLTFGVDIPFWWQEPDLATGRCLGEVTYRGIRQAASLHCIDMLDNVGVMNYRDAADGMDGMIAHGRRLVAYADQANRAIVYMGIETFLQPPLDVWFAVGLPRDLFEAALSGKARQFSTRSRFNDLRLRTFDDGQNVHLGIELPPQATAETQQIIRSAMVEIAKLAGAPSHAHAGIHVPQIAGQAAAAVDMDLEWNQFRKQDIEDAATGSKYPGFLAQNIMLSKITFADNSYEDLMEQVEAAEDFFAGYRRYGGIAIHDYQSFRAKVEPAGN